jgi:hypothetical protein
MTDTAIAIEYAKEAAEGERVRKAAEEREAVEEIVAKKEGKKLTMSCEYLEPYHTSLLYFFS